MKAALKPGISPVRLAVTTYSAPSWTIDEHARVAREIGCDGLEIRMLAGQPLAPDLPSAERRRIAEVVAEAGLEICVVGTDCRLAQPARERAREVNRAAGFIELAREWGAPVVRVFGGAQSAEAPPAAADAWVADGLHAAAEHAAPHGIRVALETHDVFNSALRVGGIVRAAAHPNAAVVWDLGHPHRAGESVAEAWAAVGPFVVHVHVKDIIRTNDDREWESVLAGRGEVPIAEMLGVLRDAGYDGYLSTEWEPRDARTGGGREAALAQHAAYLRAILDDA